MKRTSSTSLPFSQSFPFFLSRRIATTVLISAIFNGYILPQTIQVVIKRFVDNYSTIITDSHISTAMHKHRIPQYFR